MRPRDVVAQIRKVLANLIENGVASDQTFPSNRTLAGQRQVVDFGPGHDLSIVYRNLPYIQVYEALRSNRSFTCAFADGGFVQLMYEFSGRALTRHRLAYFPNPSRLEYPATPEAYDAEESFLESSNATSPVIIRADFSAANDDWIDRSHPKAHITLGEFQDCRIPMVGPMRPATFMALVLRSFYSFDFAEFPKTTWEAAQQAEQSISSAEREMTHIAFGSN